MNRLVDLSMIPDETAKYAAHSDRSEVKLASAGINYTGVVFSVTLNSMAGTYLDLPGHIAETDDGIDMAAYPLDKLYRRRAVVIHLNRPDESGAVTAAELQTACPTKIHPGDALIVNALGATPWYGIAKRSVYLDHTAVKWIIDQGVELLVSDIFESRQLEGVFLALFKARIAAVCCAVNLHELDAPEVKLTLLPLPLKNVTQMPCRIIAELSDEKL